MGRRLGGAETASNQNGELSPGRDRMARKEAGSGAGPGSGKDGAKSQPAGPGENQQGSAKEGEGKLKPSAPAETGTTPGTNWP